MPPIWESCLWTMRIKQFRKSLLRYSGTGELVSHAEICRTERGMGTAVWRCRGQPRSLQPLGSTLPADGLVQLVVEGTQAINAVATVVFQAGVWELQSYGAFHRVSYEKETDTCEWREWVQLPWSVSSDHMKRPLISGFGGVLGHLDYRLLSWAELPSWQIINESEDRVGWPSSTRNHTERQVCQEVAALAMGTAGCLEQGSWSVWIKVVFTLSLHFLP